MGLGDFVGSSFGVAAGAGIFFGLVWFACLPCIIRWLGLRGPGPDGGNGIIMFWLLMGGPIICLISFLAIWLIVGITMMILALE